jgi:Lecithin retinol acyltransferase
MSTEPRPQPDERASDGWHLRRGDHIRAGRPGVPHHDGIYLGDGHVIHLVGTHGGGKADARVQIGTLKAFAAGRPVTVRHYSGHHNPDAIIARAMSKLGDGNYHLIFNNCQHFARWCATGDHRSEQVTSTTATMSAAATPAAAASIGINLISSAGLATGLSGSGIMSGLASYGTLIGGGAVAGVVVLGAAPGLTSLAIMTHALHDDDDLPDTERTARSAGRAGSLTGALAGSVGSVAVISALGVPGLSAVGISSGLAAIGGVVGGGMAAGAMTVIAAPAIAAAAAGYLIYRLALWLSPSTPSVTPSTGEPRA